MKNSDNRVGFHRIEYLVLILQLIILLLAGIEEATWLHSFLVDRNWIVGKDFSAVLLQISATMTTLTIAIVALMTNVINDDYAGVSVSNYILNIRPKIYTQKRIIILSMASIVFGALLHIGERYAFVFALFISELLLITFSVYSIYIIFSGRNTYINEIRSYVVSEMAYIPNKARNSAVARENFLATFRNDIQVGETKNYHTLKDIFLEVLNKDTALLYSDPSEAGARLEQDSLLLQSLISACRGNSSREIKLLVLDMLYSSYINVFSEIQKTEQPIAKDSQAKFCPLDYFNCIILMQDILYEMPASEIEKSNIDIATFFDIYVTLDYEASSDSIYSGVPGMLLECIALYIHREVNNGQLINTYYWSRLFTQLLNKHDAQSEKYNDAFYNRIAGLCITYAYAHISYGSLGFLSENLFANNSLIFFRPSKIEMILMMALHAYMYYISRESEEFISAEFKDKCRQELLEISDYQEVLSRVIAMISADDIDQVLDESNIHAHMRKHDARLQGRGANILIQGEVIHDFCVFMRLYIYVKMWHRIDFRMDVDRIINYFTNEDKADSTKEAIFSFVQITNTEDKKSVIKYKDYEKLANEMYDQLHNYVIKEYKAKESTRASKAQTEYLNSDPNSIENEIRQQLIDFTHEKLKEFISHTDGEDELEFKFQPFSYTTYTEYVNKDILNGHREELAGLIYGNFIRRLINMGALEEVKWESKYKDDSEYLKDIVEKGYDQFAGSEFLFRNRNWSFSDEFRKETDGASFIPIMGSNMASVTKKGMIHFRLLDINIHIEPVGLEWAQQLDDDRYQYEPIQGLKLEYSEDELREYLNKRQKLLTVSVNIAIPSHMGFCGMALVR